MKEHIELHNTINGFEQFAINQNKEIQRLQAKIRGANTGVKMTEETSYEEWVAQAMPEWAKELQESFRALLTRNFALSLEVDRLRHNEEIHERNNEEFDGWADEFFKANGLDHLIKSYHDFIISKIDEDCDGEEDND